MFLAAHGAIAAATALAVTRQPVAAFVIGWLMHYVADFVPHGDEVVGEWSARGQEVRRLAVIAGIDFLILTAVVGTLTWHFGWNVTVLAAVIGGILPDVFWGMEKALGRKFFGPLYDWHFRIHHYLGVRLPLWLGLGGQAVLAAGLWWWCAMRWQ